ncbi:MAG: tRNA uridine-5-carboxymethylaminomethyl(34) synthesis GTPase MnmE [Parvularculaceae bacterium]
MTTAPSTDETIFARASGAGRAGVAVFRISGPRAFEIAHGLCGSNPAVRRAGVREVRSGERDLIDRGLVILFEGPGSFTGEDVAEFHLHGSRAVEAAFAEAVAAAGARPAGPGEFTRRALMNGKLDLAQVEALADLIDAETSQQRKQALGQLEGRLSAVAEGWRARLIAILAPLEADIDFPDEEGVPAAIAERAGPAIDALLAELKSYREGSGAARRLREGVSVAIIGAPNAGKSSLLNALAGADVAIVSERAGTTRDIVETRLDLGGVPVLFADTAGLRDQSTDEIEIEGMRRALARAEAADLRLLVIDPDTEQNAVVFCFFP